MATQNAALMKDRVFLDDAMKAVVISEVMIAELTLAFVGNRQMAVECAIMMTLTALRTHDASRLETLEAVYILHPEKRRDDAKAA